MKTHQDKVIELYKKEAQKFVSEMKQLTEEIKKELEAQGVAAKDA